MNRILLGASERGIGLSARWCAVVALLVGSLALVTGVSADSPPVVRPDSRLVYASASSGNDANDGLTPATPKRTLAAAAELMRQGSPDWLLLRRGDVWNEGLAGFSFSGRNASEPAVVTSYGPGGSAPRVMPSDPSSARPDGSDVVTYGVEFPGGSGGGDAPVLEPGSGWTGPTAQPGAVGNPGARGYDAKAIARWDVVPFQTFDGEFEVGVVAFHINGIERVDFAVDGGSWVSVYEMTLNPRTGVWEYWVKLDASLHADGPVEVRAIAWPTVGEPRVLAGAIIDDSRFLGEYSMHLSANAGASLPSHRVWVDAVNGNDDTGNGSESNPFRNIWRASTHLRSLHTNGDGATILCKPGEYPYYRPNGSGMALTTSRWLTVRPAPGVSRHEVVLVSHSESAGNGLNTDLVRFQDLTITTALNAWAGGSRRLWLDRCHLRDGASFWSESWYRQSFATDCLATNMGHIFMGSDLVRNAEVVGVNNDVFVGVAVVLNGVVSGQDATGTNNHSDIWQPRDILENIILYGIEARASDNREQGIFSRTTQHRDVAIVNCAIHEHGYPNQNQWRTLTHHMVVRNNTFYGTPYQIALSDSSNNIAGFLGSTNILLERNVFQWVNISDVQNAAPNGPSFESIANNVDAQNNHFINLWPDYHSNAGAPIGIVFGEGYTTGLNIPEGVGAP